MRVQGDYLVTEEPAQVLIIEADGMSRMVRALVQIKRDASDLMVVVDQRAQVTRIESTDSA